MTTTVTVQCTSCEKSYQAPIERAGARFKCKQCGTVLTVPHAPTADRPVVMPSPPAAERPVVAPTNPAPERPLVAPSAPRAERPVVAPAAPERERPAVRPPAPAPRRPAPERAVAPPGAGRAGRAHAAPEPPPEKKSRTALVAIIAGAVLLLGAGGYYLATQGSNEPQPVKPQSTVATTPQEPPKAPDFDPERRFQEIKSASGADSAAQIWSLAQKLDAEAKAWREKGAPAAAVDKLVVHRDGALEDLVKVAPDHAEGRAMRGEVRYEKELDPFFDKSYLSDSDRDLVRRNRLFVDTEAGEHAGWITKTSYETKVKPLVEKFSAMDAEAASRDASPFGQAARKMEAEVLNDMNKLLGGKAAFRTFIHHPYVIFVEENPGWSPYSEAKNLFSPLKAILEAFLREFGGLGLKPLDVPVPVLYFKSEERYGEYNKAIGNTGIGVLAHYEPATGRLALNRGVSHEVIIHEGTHQVFDKYTQNVLPHPRQSFWFQEGVAEWFGGSNRVQAKDGSWSYETGVLLDGRLTEWVTLEDSEFKLPDLLDQTYSKRNEYMGKPDGQKKIGLVYAQGWFLIYFLNHFNVDDQGMVRIGTKGKYADRWNDYLKAELTGKTGRKVFMECLKLDDAGLERMNKEYRDYFNFVRRKKNLGQVQDKKLVAWDKYVNKAGKKTGEKDDDLLIDPKRKDGR